MKVIVVLDPEKKTKWDVIDKEFEACPSSPVKYTKILPMSPVLKLGQCPPVEIINEKTGAKTTGYPIKI